MKSPFHHFHPPKIACLPGTRQTPDGFLLFLIPKLPGVYAGVGVEPGEPFVFFGDVEKKGVLGIHSGNLTQQWKIHHLKMYFLFKMGIFHCYVCLPEGSNKNSLT